MVGTEGTRKACSKTLFTMINFQNLCFILLFQNFRGKELADCFNWPQLGKSVATSGDNLVSCESIKHKQRQRQLSSQVLHPPTVKNTQNLCARACPQSEVTPSCKKSFKPLGNYGNNFFNRLMATAAVLFIGSRTRAWLKSANVRHNNAHSELVHRITN